MQIKWNIVFKIVICIFIGMRCIDCGYNCHEKCLDQVPKNCTKYKSVSDSGAVSASVSKGGSVESSSVASSK